MSRKNKGRKWILSLGFTDAQADSFIENEVPDRKIEALAEVRNSGKIIDRAVIEPFVAASGEAPPEVPAEVTQTSEKPDEGKGSGDYLCPKCNVTHRSGSGVHRRHLKLVK